MASYRTLARAGVKGLLDTYKAANPTLLRSTWTAKPGSLAAAELPCAWIDHVDALEIRHMNSIRQQTLEVVVSLADVVPDSQEEVIREDALVDALMDIFTAGYHATDGYSITEQVGYTSRLEDEGGVLYPVVDFAIRINTQEGRTP